MDLHLACGQQSDAFREEFVLGYLDPLMEGFSGIVIQDRHGTLTDDGAGIDTGVDEVDGTAGCFDAVVEGLFPGRDAWKGWKQRGMDVDDSAGEGLQERAFEDAHEAGQDNQVHVCPLEAGNP